ncbi:Uncharacterised protein [Enterococcus mundtii]|nr:Uncharacterised protein [Enterococcus mundtii]
MNKNITDFRLNFYRTSVYVLLILVSIYSAFIGKTHITTINISKGIETALFLFVILGICQIPEFITLYTEKIKESKEDQN